MVKQSTNLKNLGLAFRDAVQIQVVLTIIIFSRWIANNVLPQKVNSQENSISVKVAEHSFQFSPYA